MSDSFAPPPAAEVERMFDRIAKRYDFLNLVLSLGQDHRWRHTAAGESIRSGDETILDVGTGSGKLLRTYLRSHSFKRAVGLDFSEGMLDLARRTLGEFPGAVVEKGDFLSYEASSESFNIISASFVLRSVADRLDEFFRKALDLLKPGGRLVILELTRPEGRFVKFFFRLYVKFYLPIMGFLVSGNHEAYQFLSSSVLQFKTRGQVKELLGHSGFRSVTMRLLSGGIGTLFIAEK